MNDCIIDYSIRMKPEISKEMAEALSLLMPKIRELTTNVNILITSTPNGKNSLYEEYKKQKFFADWQKVIDSEVNDS
jgi:hypothetical protein